jgi:hypothetical protein
LEVLANGSRFVLPGSYVAPGGPFCF